MQKKFAKVVNGIRDKGGNAEVVGNMLRFMLGQAGCVYTSEVEKCGPII